MLVIIYINI